MDWQARAPVCCRQEPRLHDGVHVSNVQLIYLGPKEKSDAQCPLALCTLRVGAVRIAHARALVCLSLSLCVCVCVCLGVGVSGGGGGGGDGGGCTHARCTVAAAFACCDATVFVHSRASACVHLRVFIFQFGLNKLNGAGCCCGMLRAMFAEWRFLLNSASVVLWSPLGSTIRSPLMRRFRVM